MYTFFAAGTDGSGIVYPIKLKVKEIGNDGQEIPANISNYLGDNIDGFSTLYDTVVLAVDEIEDLPGSARPPADKAAERKYPGKSSTVKIAELLELVKGDAEEYIPNTYGCQYDFQCVREIRKEPCDRGDCTGKQRRHRCVLCKKRSADPASCWGPIPHTASAINRFYRYCTQVVRKSQHENFGNRTEPAIQALVR